MTSASTYDRTGPRGRLKRSAGCLCAVAMGLFAQSACSAATVFAPVEGLLRVKAGSHATMFFNAATGSQSHTDQSSEGGSHFANAILSLNLTGTQVLNFQALSVASTTATLPAGSEKASAGTNFTQKFATSKKQWIELDSQVLSPAVDPNSISTIAFGIDGSPPLWELGDTGGAPAVRSAVLPAGTYSLAADSSSRAVEPFSHGGGVSGYLIIAKVADFDANNVVNAVDQAGLLSHFGQDAALPAAAPFDVDENGTVIDGNDILIFQRQLGTNVPAAIAIPEPGTLGLAGVCAMAAGALNRKRISRRPIVRSIVS